MNIIFIGSIYPDNLLKELIGMGSYIDFPANNLQTALLKGLDESYKKIKVISSSPVSAFPKINKWNFRRMMFSHNEGQEKRDVNVGVLNLPLIALFSRFLRIRSELKRSIVKDEKNVVIAYGLHTPFLLATWALHKKLYKTCVIVPDLPQFMCGKRNIIYQFAKSIDRTVINFCLKSINSFVLLTPYMKEKLPIADKPIVVMDGIFAGNPDSITDIKKDNHKVILYTGNTFERSGIFDLIEAFKQIDDSDYRLWIRAFGQNVDIVRERIKDDKRINFFPAMSRDELLILERKATVLVNPVRPSQKHTRYFFPSKTMEYLASATPTIMYHLDCISKEYDSHIHYIPDQTIESLRDTLIEVCEQSEEERYEFGKSAESFILNRRNPKVQVANIVKLIDS